MKFKDLISFLFFLLISVFLGIRTYKISLLNFYLTTFFSLLLSSIILIWLIKNHPPKKKIPLNRIKNNNKKAKIGVAIIMSVILYLASIGILNIENLERVTSPVGYFLALIFAITSVMALIRR